MGFLDHLTVTQLERGDWSEFSLAEKTALAGELFHRAPSTDAYVKRIWVARLLGLPLPQLNRILWQTAGVRWPMVLPKRQPRRSRQEPTAAREGVDHADGLGTPEVPPAEF